MTNENENQLQVNNPCTGAISYGLGGAVSIALGSWAWFHETNLRANTLTVLAGGAVTGAIAGSVGCCVPATDEDSSLCARIGLGTLNSALALTAYLTAPLMGEAMLNYGTKWNEVVIQELAGGATIVGGVAALAIVGGVICCAPKLAECCSTLFSGSSTNRSLTEKLNNPVAMMDKA